MTIETTNVHNSGNETGHVDQASKTDQAKLEGKSRPQKLIPPSRNISDFNPQQHQLPTFLNSFNTGELIPRIT